jgi:hypothetical protein
MRRLRVVFLVVGSEKAEILHAVLQEKREPPLPRAARAAARPGQKLFLVDKAAAAMLTPADSSKPTPGGKTAGTTRGQAGEKHVILAGDIGGTKCNLALYEVRGQMAVKVRQTAVRKPRIPYLR